MKGERVMGTHRIQVCELEFDGKTIWVHGMTGGTVLRLKVDHPDGITMTRCGDNPNSHVDIMVKTPVVICVANDLVQ